MRYPYEVNLVGDAAATLRALIPHLKRQEDRSWREGIEAGVERWWRSMDAEADVEANPINPMLLFRELSDPAARERDRRRRLGLVRELVRPAAEVPR